jgi:hypothetical protein
MNERVLAKKKTSTTPPVANQACSPLLHQRPLTDELSESLGSNSNISKELGGIQPKTIRRSLNWQNITVEAPSRGNGMSLPGGIQRQQEEPGAVSGERVSADSAQKSALESSNSKISTSEPAQKPLIARAPFNGQNIPVEAPPRSAASSTYPGGIQRLETSGVKEQESTESLQMLPQSAIQAKSSEGEPQEKEEQNKELVQTKLTVGAPGDKYEQEADSMAAKVMRMPDKAVQQPIQRQTGEETEAVQMQPEVNSITPLVQRSSGQEEEVQMKSGLQRASDGSSVASGNVENQLAGSKGGGSALSDDVRSFMEPRFGADFSSVRVHTDSNAVQMNKDLGAQAFAHGSDIYYGAGKSPGKDELTAHELTHTVQQTGAVRRSKKRSRSEMEPEESFQEDPAFDGSSTKRSRPEMEPEESFQEDPAFDPKADYSASDSEYVSTEDEQSTASPGKKKKRNRTRAIYNYTKKGQAEQDKEKVNNKVPGGEEGLEAAKSQLNSHATQIHDVLPRTVTPQSGKNPGIETNNRSFGATTITTAILRDKKTRALKKFVFSNVSGAGNPAIRAKAYELGYHVVSSRDKSHAETQMIRFVDARGSRYELVSQGVDKEHCIECDQAMKTYFGEDYPTEHGVSEKKYPRWYQPRRLKEALKNPRPQTKEPPNKEIKIEDTQTEVKPPEDEFSSLSLHSH